jgi:hypothetical protein
MGATMMVVGKNRRAFWLLTRLGGLAAAGLLAGGLMLIPVGGGEAAVSLPRQRPRHLDLSAFPEAAPEGRRRLLFIHHSCGGQLLAPPGPDRQSRGRCIYDSHPNGGSLRKLLSEAGYEVHEASYGSVVGEDTDLFHWADKFRGQMDLILRTDHQDVTYSDGRRNQIVVFKSCFPNNQFESEGQPPGNPAGPELTVWNARAALQSLLPIFSKHPQVLFVYLTAPPVAPRPPRERLFRRLISLARGEGSGPTPAEIARSAELARAFNTWAASTDGWLAGYPGQNLVVFDLYDLLTGEGQSNLLAYPTRGGTDSHAAREGNERVARALVPFLNRAVRRAGIAATF